MKRKKIIAMHPYLHNKSSLTIQLDVYNSWERLGGSTKKGIRIPLWIQYVIAKLKLTFNISQKGKTVRLFFGGGTPDYSIFPYCFYNEVIPMLWDCWPKYHNRLFASLVRNKIRTVILTSSQLACIIRQKFPLMNVIYLPEGIDETKYKNNCKLIDRHIDLLEFGRPSGKIHDLIVAHKSEILKSHRYSMSGWIFPDHESFINGLADTKIAITFPRCDTDPVKAGNIETLTQRYWECMLSGCILLGRAPQELIDLIGYNPVVTVDPVFPHLQIDDILNHLNDYQEMVERNYLTALEYASWDIRVSYLKKELVRLEYNV